MCGIVGYVGKEDICIRVLMDGLKRLEYRGYDSAGIAYLSNGNLCLKKEEGKLEALESKVDFSVKSNLGIGHTRWATHGSATRENAHPHRIGKFTIVHNGIIENYVELRKYLMEKGYTFYSETDTEVIASFLDYLYKDEKDVLKCINRLNKMLKGSYALAIICEDKKDEIYVLKNKSPLIIGAGNNENYIASDVHANLDKVRRYINLEDGDYASITSDEIKLYNDGNEKKIDVKEFLHEDISVSKEGYKHFMLKEINEQPEVFERTTKPYLESGIDSLIEKMPNFNKYNKIRIVACGSATHASLVGKQMIEKYANVKTEVDTASEFRYNKLFLDKDELVILVSQSGETADTLEALKIAKNNGNDTLGIINVKGSTIAREAKLVLYTEAGSEIAVATTKAYSAQVAMLSLIALNLSYKKNLIDKETLKEILKDAKTLPLYMKRLLSDNSKYEKIAKELANHNDIFYIGRGVDYALSMEGALKLKEISYVHSEAYAAGELKHGTISLIEEGTPVIAIVTDDYVASKTISNIKEVKARGAKVIYITNRKEEVDTDFYDEKIYIPKVNDLFTPLLTVIPLQEIAYNVASIKECSIDKPRNLAKSVTVE